MSIFAPWTNHEGLVCGTMPDGSPSFDIFDAANWPSAAQEPDALEIAALIASAPDLLAALEALLRVRSVNTLEEAAREYPHGKEDVADEINAFDAARAAITKATQEQAQ